MRKNVVERSVIIAGLCFLLAAVFSCAVNPVTGRQELALMSEQQEIEIGKGADPEVLTKYGYYPDPALQDYVRSVGEPLARVSHRPSLAYHFKVVDSPGINAFALPGGYVYVTRGILAYLNSEAELAGVLGHEIGHITERHAVQQLNAAMGLQLTSLILSSTVPGAGDLSPLTDILFSGIMNGYGRSKEFSADRLGQLYMSRGGYDPDGMVEVLSTLDRTQKDPLDPVSHWVLSSHPYAADRIQRASVYGQELAPNRPLRGGVDRDRYLGRIDGLVFGPGKREGVLTGRLYRNSYFRVSCTVPEGWKVQAGRDRWSAETGDKDSRMEFRLEETKNPLDPGALASRVEKDLGLARGRLLDRRRQDGGEMLAVEYGARSPSGLLRVFGGYFVSNGIAGTLIGMAPEGRETRVLPAWRDVLVSIRRLTEAEAEQVPLMRVRIHRVRSGDTFPGLAQRFLGDPGKAERIAEINGMNPREVPVPGTTLKVIALGAIKGKE